MEEVDTILLSQLREIGCDIDDSFKNLANLDAIQLMKYSAQCLQRILAEHANIHVPSPQEFFFAMNMSVKFKMANQLSELIRDIGYKSDIGYQTFLYGNEHEIRRLLLFLIERIPREDESSSRTALLDGESDSGTCSKTIELLRRMNLGTVWIPPDSTNKTVNYFDKSSSNYRYIADDLEFCLEKFLTKSQLKPLQRVSKCSLSRVENQFLLPVTSLQILEYNSTKQFNEMNSDNLENNCLLFTLNNKTSSNAIDNESFVQDKENNQFISRLHAHVQNENSQETLQTQNEAEYFRTKLDDYKRELQGINEKINEHEQKSQEFASYEQIYSEKCKQYEANSKSNQELNSDIQKVKSQIAELTNIWQNVQDDLYSQIDQLKSESMAQNYALKDKMQKISYLKKIITTKMKDVQTKQELIRDLTPKLSEDWPAGRTAYTKRIIEIISNVTKQNSETKKVLAETKSIQKDINSLNGKIARSFAMSEETIFREAKQNDWNRKCYKTLALLQTTFDQLLELVSSVGSCLREIRHLEEMTEIERERCAEANLSRINADLAQIQEENSQIESCLNQKQF